MATRKKSSRKSPLPAIEEHAAHLLDEAEKAGESVISQVRRLFDGLAQRVSNAAQPATPPESQSGEAVGEDEAARAAGIIDHVRDASEASVRAISDGFESVRRRIVERVSASAAARPRKKASKKTAGKKTAGKKAAGKKAAGKKAASKKAACKKAAG